MLNSKSFLPKSPTNSSQKIMAIKNLKRGEIKKIIKFPKRGTTSSLEKSLRASEKGCTTPKNPNLFGPFRN
jgi:hypothetical protein